VRYTVKPGRSADNEELLDAVFAELTRLSPTEFDMRRSSSRTT